MEDYKEINKNSWNSRVETHLKSEFYDVEGFIKGGNSLKDIELNLLGDISGLKILHLQCHFGQDTISLARMGAKVTGIDLSDKSIAAARDLAEKCGEQVTFIQSDVYDLPNHLEGEFDIVFTSYGTITWLPDLDKWASVVNHFLKPGGKFVFAEFHPVLWMFDDDLNTVGYSYFNVKPIIEEQTGTYAQKDSSLSFKYVCWNHSLAEVFTALQNIGILIQQFQEFDYSPYETVTHMEEYEKGKYRVKHFGNQMPLTYSLLGVKS